MAGIFFYNPESSSGGGYNSVTYSDSWTSRTAPSDNDWMGVTYSPSLNLFCAVSTFDVTNPMCITSTDGITWTERTIPNGSWSDVHWGDGLFVAVQTTGNPAYSSDGINWSSGSVPVNGDDRQAVVYNPDNDQWVTVKSTGTNRVSLSSDGINWTDQATAGDAYAWYDVAWSPSLGLYCAVSYFAGPSNRMMTSPDGVTWTLRAPAETAQFAGIDWSPELGMFVAAGNNVINTSTDGINWSSVTEPVPGGNFRDVLWVSEMGKFFIANWLQDHVTYSSDGVNWSTTSLHTDHIWESLAYNPSNKTLVIVGGGSPGETDKIATSVGT